jgi:hypothetical protein
VCGWVTKVRPAWRGRSDTGRLPHWRLRPLNMMILFLRPLRCGLLLCLVWLASLPTQAQAPRFDRVASLARYQQWFGQLQTDLRTVLKNVPRDEPITPEHISKWCAQSIVPGSRAANNFSEFLNRSRSQGERTVSGEIVFVGPLTLLMRMLEHGIPAGAGGLFDEPEGSPFATRTLTVWYTHIQAGDILERHFNNPEVYKPYRLPPAGTLVRDAYPFLLFEDQGGRLRFGGFGREWWSAFEAAYSVQFH